MFAVSPSFAQQDTPLPPPAPLTPPPADAPKGPPKNFAPSAASADAKCKPVIFTREDVGDLKNFTVTVKGDLEVIKACNPDKKIDRTGNGTRIAVSYDSGAVIALPESLKDSSAHVGLCVNDPTGDVADAVIYKGTWTGGVPERVDLKKLDDAFYNKPASLAVCRKLTAERKFH
ncbi:hypothetical protein A2704_00355 [Candidatus Kaiserbacteria bacterium RIFCSPHIGHO2_01_FULL_54_36b]|uniref:Uncharacterized protein n=1 Tax=Candidatus Kaiserbacteria bacterium RIFCSPHIGHO2_01_FULL_54_36b TaxID=1798483 RepID=A0A1F6CRW8_9BACT|nr:MAG: hypothetical protein A2704_00355 [Candidatus Kaiserbacteria bacterium RIFCSPHIGHO2_01_FULL_54_36b]